MRVIVADTETTVQWVTEYDDEGNPRAKKVIDNSPYNPLNKLISVNWRMVSVYEKDADDPASVAGWEIGPDNSLIFNHNEYEGSDDPAAFQYALDQADLFVAHNAKYDVQWLTESGFKLPKDVWCTMIGEYVQARGVRKPLSLEQTAIRRDVTRKKGDLVNEYFENEIGFEAMPLPIVMEYADADVLSCAEIFLQQWNEYKELKGLNQIVQLMNDMLLFLVEIEKNGIAIDLNELKQVEIDYLAEREQLIKDMMAIASEVMGDTPINLNSLDDLTKVVYSRTVTDKHLHKEIFNLGKDEDGRFKFPPRMSNNQFNEAVRRTTAVVKRTTAEHCETCKGKGYIYKIKMNGDLYKKPTSCTVCNGAGMIYVPSTKTAGMKLTPTGPEDASVGGFKVDKDTIDILITQATLKGNDQAVLFLTKKKRLSAVNVYINSFVRGIMRWVRADGLLHSAFNQCRTATGRLSSNDPNFQNQPRGATFPVRRAIVSRFKGGHIIEADYAGIEFVTAAELSRDKQMIEDILGGKDIHRQTGSIVHRKPATEVSKEERSEVKPHTFAPLYGATGYGQLPHIKVYYEEFFKIYKGHWEWQKEKMNEVIRTGKVVNPSGREYAFPGTTRARNGKSTNATKIVNYPVQGFATADIVPLACIRLLRCFRLENLKSMLILTVHDSIVVDCYPGEEKQVYDAMVWAMTEINEEIKSRWNYDMFFKLKVEIELGDNWLDKSKERMDKYLGV